MSASAEMVLAADVAELEASRAWVYTARAAASAAAPAASSVLAKAKAASVANAAEVAAEAMIQALEARCKLINDNHVFLPYAALKVANLAMARGSIQRTEDRLKDARWTVACFVAFAKSLASRYPDESNFHLILSEAFEQGSKNARKTEDLPAVEDLLRKALTEARIALRLAPDNTFARLIVAGLQDKVARFVATPILSK